MTNDTHQLLISAFGLHQAGDLHGALRGYDEILQSTPQSFDATHLSGVALYQLGRLDDATIRLHDALALKPGDIDAQSNLALALMDLGRRVEALAMLDQVIARQPARAEARANRAACLNELGRFYEALTECEAALQIAPMTVNAGINRGLALLGLDRAVDASLEFSRWSTTHPENLALWCGYGQAQSKLGRLADADASYQRALEMNSDHIPTLINRAVLLCNSQRSDESLALAERAIALSPQLLEARMTLAMVLMRQKRYLAAIAAYDAVLAIEPGHGAALYSQGLCHLLLGQLPLGFELYEHRWHSNALKHATCPSTATRLQPAHEISNRTVLLWNDQGLGDAIHMARYATSMMLRGANVILQVPGPLVRLLESAIPDARVIAMGEAPPPHDFQCALLSAPWFFKTDTGSIPAPVSLLQPEQFLNVALALPHSDFRVGVAWSGNPSHVDDARRSLPLSQFASALQGVSDVLVLQREVRDSDRELLTQLAWDWRPDASIDFAATAALISQVDIVVSVDTSVAHLAASLGKPTWLLVPYLPDWRWWGDGADTAWYNTMRLFRQSAADDWGPVLSRINHDLLRHAASEHQYEAGTAQPNKTHFWSRVFRRATRAN